MNIFALSPDPFVAATMHCDKHIVKMTTEYAQLLSTAHRVLDGVPYMAHSLFLKDKAFLLLPGEGVYLNKDLDLDGCWVYEWYVTDRLCYNATHRNHPSAVWARETNANYWWLVRLFLACLTEYTRRYGKKHACEKLLTTLPGTPKNIPNGKLTPFPQTMPPEYQVPNDPVLAYRNFYIGSKARFARWTNSPVPAWFADAITSKGLNVSDFTRTRSVHQ